MTVADEWMLIAVLSADISLDGFCVVRIGDVEEIEQRTSLQNFVSRSLMLQGDWPPEAPSIDLAATDAMIADLSTLNRTLTIFIEEIDADVCFIGVPIGLTRTSLGLSEIRYTAEWQEDPTEWDFADISRIDFGERYTARLLDVALEADVPEPVTEHFNMKRRKFMQW